MNEGVQMASVLRFVSTLSGSIALIARKTYSQKMSHMQILLDFPSQRGWRVKSHPPVVVVATSHGSESFAGAAAGARGLGTCRDSALTVASRWFR